MKLRAVLPLVLSLAGPVSALEIDAMSDTERAAFRNEIRAYLLENPEVLQEAIGVLQLREQQAKIENDKLLAQTYHDTLHNDGYSFVGGNPDGDITIIEFMDYRCGFCKRAFPEVEELITADANIRFVVKELPILGEQSELASRFAIATQLVEGEDAYKDVHNTLMEFQGNITEQSLARLSDALALDTDAIVAKMDDESINDIIEQNRALASDMEITGTPTFVFDDQMVRGYVSIASMERIIRDIRSE